MSSTAVEIRERYADLIRKVDPEGLGLALLTIQEGGEFGDAPLSKVYDANEDDLLHLVPPYDGQPVNHAAERERELRERANSGDKFAEALLNGESLAEEPVD